MRTEAQSKKDVELRTIAFDFSQSSAAYVELESQLAGLDIGVLGE